MVGYGSGLLKPVVFEPMLKRESVKTSCVNAEAKKNDSLLPKKSISKLITLKAACCRRGYWF